MFSPASSYKCKCKSGSRAACGRRALVALTLALALLPDIVWGAQDEHIVSITDARKPDTTSDVVVLTLTNVERPAAEDANHHCQTRPASRTLALTPAVVKIRSPCHPIALPPVDSELLPLFAAARRAGHHMFDLFGDFACPRKRRWRGFGVVCSEKIVAGICDGLSRFVETCCDHGLATH